MRYLCILLAVSALAQQSSSTSSRLPDLNGGNTTEGQSFSASKSANASSRTEFAPSINGALVPRETMEEKVIRDDANGRLVERYVRRHDPNGNAGPVEKTVIEEKKSGGTLTVNTTVYRSDLNGNLRPAERSVSQSVKQGSVTSTDTTIERTGLDGALAPAERVSATLVEESKTRKVETVSRMRRDANGNYYEAVKETSDREESADGRVTVNRAQYVGGALAEQAVSRTVKDASGGTSTTVDIFSSQAPGLSADVGGKLALKEQQQFVREPGPGGKMTETVVSRKPTVADANRLGPAQVISKSVCQGACNP